MVLLDLDIQVFFLSCSYGEGAPKFSKWDLGIVVRGAWELK